jgi:hypothetical protein
VNPRIFEDDVLAAPYQGKRDASAEANPYKREVDGRRSEDEKDVNPLVVYGIYGAYKRESEVEDVAIDGAEGVSTEESTTNPLIDST